MFFFVQKDFKVQKCEIKKSITHLIYIKYHIVIYYSKYHSKLNYIERFWYSAKNYVCKNCNYTINNLQKRISHELANISNYIILIYFYKYRQKIELYYKRIRYRSLQ